MSIRYLENIIIAALATSHRQQLLLDGFNNKNYRRIAAALLDPERYVASSAGAATQTTLA